MNTTVGVFLLCLSCWLLSRRRQTQSRPLYPRPQAASLSLPRAAKIKGTVVVCGGSIAGLLSAKVCAKHFEHVLLIDPEISKSAAGVPKTRVLQYQSLHAWSLLIMEALRQLWPEFDETLERAGAWKMPSGFSYTYQGYPVIRPTANAHPPTFSTRRHVIESNVASLLAKNTSNVRTIDGTVRAMKLSAPDQVGSVTIRTNDNQISELEDVSLLIDCTGTTQAGLKWLSGAGYQLPENIRLEYDPSVRYVTMYFKLSDERLATLPIPGGWENKGWLITYMNRPPEKSNVFIINRTDNNLLQILCGAWGTTPLPRIAAHIPPFLANLQATAKRPLPSWIVSVLDEIVEHGEMIINDIIRFPASSNVRYEMMEALPSNFIAVGDSTMKLNPVYGQGFGKAALSCMMLNDVLTDCHTKSNLQKGFSRIYFESLAPHIQALWNSTKTHDYGFHSTVPVSGEDPNHWKYRLARWISHHSLLASVDNEYVANTLFQIRQLKRPGSDAMKPRMIFYILKQALFGY